MSFLCFFCPPTLPPSTKVSASLPTSVADAIMQFGKDNMPSQQHKQTKAKVIVEKLEEAYGDAGKAALESKVVKITTPTSN